MQGREERLPGSDLNFKWPEPWVTSCFSNERSKLDFHVCRHSFAQKCRQRNKTGRELSLSCSLSPFPPEVQGGGLGRAGEEANKILAAWACRSPGACLCSVRSFSLFFGPADTSWLVTGPGRGGGGEELGEAREKEKKVVKNGFSGAAGEKRARVPHRGVLGLAGHQSPSWQKEGGQWNQNSKGQPEGGGDYGGRGGGFSESYK